MFTRWFIIPATAGALLMLLPRPVQAGYVVQAFADANTILDNPGPIFDAGAATADARSESGLFVSIARAAASPGTLGSFASVQVASADPGVGQVYAFARAGFTDTLRVGSASLPAGTPVILLFSQQVEGGFRDLDGFVLGYVVSQMNPTIGLTDSNYILHADGRLQDSGPPILAWTTVGATISLRGTLSVQASYRGGPDGGSLTSDFYHTAHYYADSLTEGVFLTSDSGHDYSSPGALQAVPEPGSFTLAAMGVLGCFGYRWSRTRFGK